MRSVNVKDAIETRFLLAAAIAANFSSLAAAQTPGVEPSLVQEPEGKQEGQFAPPSPVAPIPFPRPTLLPGQRVNQGKSFSDVGPDPMSQLNSVQQLSDVEPTDWAYEALRSLVERYGCLVGYPDGSFRGNRALSRWEFAAGLNACLNTVERLLQENVAVLREDIEKLKRLATDFQAELTALGHRLQNLDSRVSFLEDHQFSTTTKLMGNAIFAVADVFNDGGKNQTVFQYRANLNLITSFTGRDALLLGLFAGDVPFIRAETGAGTLDVSTAFNLPGQSVPIPGTPFSVEASTAEGTLSSQFGANTNNELRILAMGYSFPVGDSVNVALVSAFSPFQLYAPTLNPYLDDRDSGTGAISVFGEYNPLYTLVGGGTGAIVNYQLGESLKLTAGYMADGLLAGSPGEGQGLFNGGYGALGQITWNLTDNFALAGVYLNDYATPGRFGFNYNGLGVTGTATANSLSGQEVPGGALLGIDRSAVLTNGYGVQLNWRLSPAFSLSGWFSTFYPRLIGQGDGNILTYALTFAFPDLGKEGNLLGLVVGAEPYLTDFDGGNPQPFAVDVPWHLETFYRYQINDRISLTPGVIWLLAPNQDNNNPDAVIGTVRMTLSF